VEGSFEHGNEPSGSITRWKILELLRNWRLLRKGSAPWSYLVTCPTFSTGRLYSKYLLQ
jgi:hypothetical protein